MSSQDLIDRLLVTRPVINDEGNGLSLRQHPVQDGPYFLRVSLRPFGRLGHVLWLHTETMQAQLDLTDEQVVALAKMFKRYDEENVDYAKVEKVL